MPHMMDDFPLLLSTLYDRAVRLYPDRAIVSVAHDGVVERTTYGATDVRIRKLASAMRDTLGLEIGDAVGTFAWNNRRHHEIYWATANTGRICHTLNVRLFPDQLAYIVNHGTDRVVFVDPDLVPLAERFAGLVPHVEAYVVMADEVPETTLPNAIAYEDLISDAAEWGEWPVLDERSPMMLCFTSGTTGHPKGVAYTQRSTYLHTISNLAARPLDDGDVMLPVVPMFHAAAWGYPFMATTVGASIVYPGPDLSPAGLVGLIEQEAVTFSAGVPTVWLGIQQHLMDHPDADISSIRTFLCGGSAVPRALIEWFATERDVLVLQGWGMTETNPVASAAQLRPEHGSLPLRERLDRLQTAGVPIAGLQVKIVDEEGAELPWDGNAFGELLIRGPWIAAEYYEDERSAEAFADGWLRTGDVCKITSEGYIVITDRAKDVIKSGGEWISSLDLERELMAHPSVAEAVVVGVAHVKWQERPVAVVVARPGVSVTESDLLDHLGHRVVKWWLPDRIEFAEELPKTGTGKYDKKAVRQRFEGLVLDG
jgi:fatty-acyl-CoA synthase